MNKTPTQSAFEKRLESFKEDLKQLGLKPLRSTVPPKDSIFAIECLYCGGFWQQRDSVFHFPECNNSKRNEHAKEVIISLLKKHDI